MHSALSPKTAAFSLAEVLAVLAIAAIALIAVAQLSVRLLVQIKNNEIADFANAVLLQALETAKSPGDVIATSGGGITGSYDGSYRIDFTASPRVLWRETVSNTPITDCPETSPYKVKVSSLSAQAQLNADVQVCLQVIVQQRRGLVGQAYYELRARTVYIRPPTVITSDAYGYRREAFVAPDQAGGNQQ